MATNLGTSDCERIGPGFLSQPANAVSSLAFVVAGWGIARHRADRSELGMTTGLVGVGSFLAHGPRWPGSEWLHDVTIAWVLTTVWLADRPRWMRWLVYGAVGGVYGVKPAWRNRISGALAVWAIGRQLGSRRRTRATVTAAAFLGAGAVVGNLTRTGMPWCDPDSIWQGHAAWHILAASGLAAWGFGDRHRQVA